MTKDIMEFGDGDADVNHIQEPNLLLAARLKVVIWVVTAAVLVLVGLMQQVKIDLPEGVDLSFLPAVHAIINSSVVALLIAALLFVKRGNVVAHQRAISFALGLSVLFLLCYVSYHFTNDATRYGGEGLLRFVYLILLISHIVLAAVSFPFILLTWMYAYTNQIQQHRWLAKMVFPVWLYVAATGPICYLMLRPYYE